MSPIYYIFKKNYHWNKITDQVFDFDDQQTILTKKKMILKSQFLFRQLKQQDIILNINYI